MVAMALLGTRLEATIQEVRARAAMTRRTTFEHDGREVAIEYRPELFADPGFLALLNHVQVTNDLGLSARALTRVLASWSVATRGRPTPITAAAILELPFPLHLAIVRAIAADGGGPPAVLQARGDRPASLRAP